MKTMKRCGFASTVSASGTAPSTAASVSSASGLVGAALLSTLLLFVALGSFACVRFRFFVGCLDTFGSVFEIPADSDCCAGFVVEEARGSVWANFRLRASFRLASAPPPRSRSVASAGMPATAPRWGLGFRFFVESWIWDWSGLGYMGFVLDVFGVLFVTFIASLSLLEQPLDVLSSSPSSAVPDSDE